MGFSNLDKWVINLPTGGAEATLFLGWGGCCCWCLVVALCKWSRLSLASLAMALRLFLTGFEKTGDGQFLVLLPDDIGRKMLKFDTA